MASFSRPFPRLLIAAGIAIIAVSAVILLSIQANQKPKAAWADTPVSLNPSHVGATAADFETIDCTGPLANPPGPNHDGWHFVLPDSSGDNFTSITIVYSGGVVAGPITSTDENNPDSGPGWVGFLDATGSGDVKHAYIFTTPAGQSIVSGTATVSPDETPPPGTFNLSHTCPAASPSPSPSPSRSVSPSPSVSVSPSASTSPAPSPSISTSPTPSASTSRPPRPSPSRTRPPGYGYGSTEHMTIRTSWWRSYFG